MPVDGQALQGNCSPDVWNGNTLLVQRMVELFYSEDPEEIDTAKSICEGCPVQKQCLIQGLHEEFGIWGGLTPEERKRYQ